MVECEEDIAKAVKRNEKYLSRKKVLIINW